MLQELSGGSIMGSTYFKKDRTSGYTGRTGLVHNGRQRTGIQRLWRALRQLFPATAKELAEMAELSDSTALFYLNFLERAGYLWREPQPTRLYHLIKNTGRHAPQMRSNGSELYDTNNEDVLPVPEKLDRWPGEPAKAGSPEHCIWQAMRMLRTFTVGELAVVTEQEEAVISAQVKNLHRFKYLRECEASFGEPGYLLPLYRDTGDKPPAICNRLGKLYDFKTKEIISLQE